MFSWYDSLFVVLLKTGWLHFLFFFVVCGFDCVNIFHSTCRIVFASSGIFLVAEDRDDSSGCLEFHAQVSLVDDCCELDDTVAAEDSILWVGNVYHVKGFELYSLSIAFAEGYIQLYFAEGFNSFPPKPISGY